MQLDEATYQSRKFGVSQGETVVKLLFCYENGLPLSTANTGLYIVKGRLAVEGNVIATQLRRHPDYDYRIKRLDDTGCVVEILHSGQVIGESSFTEDDAKKAGLVSKDNYQNYPRNMYFNRAISNGYKWFAPDIFSQAVYVPGEVEDTIDAPQWQVIDQKTATESAKAAISLDDLVARYGAEAIMQANNGMIPATDEEVAAVAAKLEGENHV